MSTEDKVKELILLAKVFCYIFSLYIAEIAEQKAEGIFTDWFIGPVFLSHPTDILFASP